MSIAPTPSDVSLAPQPVERDRSLDPASMRDDGPPPVAEAEMSFWDFLDVVNPLQHIPVIGHIYREITGDQINGTARVMGGILFGGVLGGAVAVANAVVEDTSGRDVGEHMLAALGLSDDAPESAQPQIAALGDNAGKPPTAAIVTPPGTSEQTAAPTATPAADAMPPAPGARTATATNADLRTALASPAGEHRPGKMPARDTPLASSLMARHRIAAAQGPQLVAATPAPAGAIPAPSAPNAAGSAAASASAVPAANADQPIAAVPPERMPDVMLRNLAKYEQARRSALRQAAGVDVSG